MPEELTIKAGDKYLAQVLVSVVAAPDVADRTPEQCDRELAEYAEAALAIYSTVVESVVPFTYANYSLAELRAMWNGGYTEVADVLERSHPAAVLHFVYEGLSEKWLSSVDLRILVNLLMDRLTDANKKKFFLGE